MTVGLSAAEVVERVEQGRTNQVPDAPTRTTGEIVRANVLTPVNLVISVLLVAIVVAEGIGPDMLFGGVIVTNSVIGIIQELRARAALDRLAVLTTPRALAWRDGVQRDLDVAEVVEDDLLVLAPGAQVVVDGTVVDSSGLELNESLLTGEQDAVHKDAGDEVLSGSFVAVGSGTYRAVRVGAASYAAGLAEEARRFTLVDSELRRGVNTILKVLMALIPPIAAILFWRLLETGEGWRQALSGVVAAAVAMVPDGLVLLTSLAFMAGVVTLARRGALLRELASVELLARVDTLCLDKTGTITTGDLVVSAIEPLGDQDAASAAAMLAAIAAADADPNPTLAAVADAAGEVPDWPLAESVAFSSARKWAGAQFTRPAGPEDTLTLYLGAPELLAPDDPALTERVAAHAAQGRRVLLLVRCAEEVELDEQLPELLEPVALVLLEDQIRPDAQETLGYFAEQGIRLLVISGDHPGTVAAVARRAGVPDADVGVDARTLPEDPDELADELDRHAVYGRVTPRQKRAMVLALQSRDRVVAMTGDGVNDVLALKDADMGIAMGSGSGASRSVAQLVLLEDRFSILPGVLAEGRRVMNSVERASNLFIYGTVYAVLVSLVIAAIGVEFPFLPRHLTLVRVLSVGIPGFFLALAPDPRRARAGFLDRVVRFSLPAGAIAATGALVVYLSARATAGVGLTESRTATTVALLGIGLILLVRLTGSLPPWRWALVSAMVVATLAVVFVAPLAAFFDLELPPASVLWVVLGVLGAAALAIQLVPVEDAARRGGRTATRVG